MEILSHEALADRQAISDLVAAFADAVSRRDAVGVGALWIDDGEWHVPGLDVARGPSGVTAQLERLLTGFVSLTQVVHSGVVQLDAGVATGRWYLSEIGVDAEGNAVQFVGVYRDAYRRTESGWRFAERRFNFLFRGRLEGRAKGYPHPGT